MILKPTRIADKESPSLRTRRICVVAPCFNEEAVLMKFYKHLKQVLGSLHNYNYEILLVDDGSYDETFNIMSELHRSDSHVGFLSLSRNFGHQIALTAGLDACDADAVIMMDCDLQHPPDLIPLMIQHWERGADIVSAVRTTNQQSPTFKNLTSGIFYRFINFLSDTTITPQVADFNLLSQKALNAFQAMPEQHRFIRGMISWIGFRREFVEFQTLPRAAGSSKYSWHKMIALAMTAIYSFSAQPLRFATRVGWVIAGLGLFDLLFVIWVVFYRPDDVVPGWASVIGVVLIIGGTQLIFTGLIGEYIARLYEEAKRRPLYFLKQSKRARGGRS